VTSGLRCSTAPLWFRKFENNYILRRSLFLPLRSSEKFEIFLLRRLWPLKMDGAGSSETSVNNKIKSVTFRKGWVVILNVVTSPVTLLYTIPVFIAFKQNPLYFTVYINFLHKCMCKNYSVAIAYNVTRNILYRVVITVVSVTQRIRILDFNTLQPRVSQINVQGFVACKCNRA
jgi:hypothetical protein